MEKYTFSGEQEKCFSDLKSAAELSDIEACAAAVEAWKKAAETDEQNLLTSPDEVKEILENVKEALENFDTLLVDEAVEEMGKMHFPDNQKELFKKRKKPPKPRISSFARRLSRSGNDFCKQKIKQKSIPVINFAGIFLISSSFC